MYEMGIVLTTIIVILVLVFLVVGIIAGLEVILLMIKFRNMDR